MATHPPSRMACEIRKCRCCHRIHRYLGGVCSAVLCWHACSFWSLFHFGSASDATAFCLKGGKRDESDSDDVATAYREAFEEAGVKARDLSYLATLCPIIPIKPILISPVLAHFDKSGFVAKLNPSEVDAVFQVPTDRFLAEAGHSTKSFATESGDYLVHYFEDTVQGRTFTTWGYTAFMCIVVSALLHARKPAFTVAPGLHFELDHINATLEQFLHKKLQYARSLNNQTT